MADYDKQEFTELPSSIPPPTNGYTWSPELQRKIVALALRDKDAYSQLGPKVFDTALFNHPPLKTVATILFKACADNNGYPPTTDLLAELLKERTERLRPAMAEAVRTEYILIETADLTDSRLLKSKAVEWARNEAMAKAMITGAELVERGLRADAHGQSILQLVQDALAIGAKTEASVSLVHDLTLIEEELTIRVPRLPTGIPSLDTAMEGGAEVGLHVVAGDPKLGKTSFLTQIGIGGCRRGLTVWHISGEVSRRSMIRRYVSGMTNKTKLEIWDDPAKAVKILRSYKQTGGNVILDYQPDGFSVAWIASRLRQLESLGYRVDVLVCDYIDLMQSRREYVEKRHEQEQICKDLRALAVNANLRVWTAKAVNRKAVGKAVVTKADLAECFAVAYVADNLFALCATDEERRNTRVIGGKIVQAPIIRIFYAAGREVQDEYIIAAFERDNDRQRWREIPNYLAVQQDGVAPQGPAK